MRLSLRHRLVLTIGAACIVVFGAVGFAAVRAVRAELVERLDQSLLRSAANAPAAARAITPEVSERLRQATGPSEITILLATPEGTKVAVPSERSTGGGWPALATVTSPLRRFPTPTSAVTRCPSVVMSN